MRARLSILIVLLATVMLGCSQAHELSPDERQHARDNEVASLDEDCSGENLTPHLWEQD